MFNLMKFILHLIVLIILSSCSNKVVLPDGYQLQFLPEKAYIKEITDLQITYVIPKNILSSEGINGLNFQNRCWGMDTKQEKILVNFDNKNLQIERRTDNGVAGSGRIYKVSITKENESNNTLIRLRGESMSTYQDGLIFPFPLPEFDLQSYLTTAMVRYNFEVNSDFPAVAIIANFNRSLERFDPSNYILKLNYVSVLMKIKIYPYRNGSKVIIYAELFNMQPVNSVIDVNKNIFEFEKYIKNIVNS